MVPVSFLAAVASVLAFLAGYIPPGRSSLVAFAGLGMPAILLLNFLIAVYWIFAKKRWVYLPLAAILLNTGYLLSIFQWSPSAPGQTRGKQEILLATYNVGRFNTGQRNAQLWVAGELRNKEADIVCFQEYYNDSRTNSDSLGRVLGLPYRVVEYLPGSATVGSAIFSRYPIVRSARIPFRVTHNDAIWADIRIGKQIIRVVSCHLQTTNFSRKRKKLDDPAFRNADFSQIDSTFRDISGELKKNFEIRARQAELVCRLIDTTAYPLIVCGDFNDTPSSFAYRRIKGRLKDAFRECGNGYGYTYRGIRRLLRIDYVLYSPDMRCLSYSSPDWTYSDHKPVLVTLEL